MTGGRAASAVIRLDALRENLARIRVVAPGSRVLAVVKANAYGHGIPGAVRALSSADALAVACIDEAVAIRDADCDAPVVLLEGVFEAAELALAARHRCELVVHDPWQIDALANAPEPYAFTVWLKIDTGMNRLGFPLAEAGRARERLQQIPAVEQIRLMTHLACADDLSSEMTDHQIAAFEDGTNAWAGERSVANSAGVFAHPRSHSDWVRPGLALYGVSPFPGQTAIDLGLRPAMTLCARLIAVREVAAGETVGYCAGWQAERATRVGIVGLGYGDGYPVLARNGTPVLVNGKRCPLVGRVSMDMLAVDLSGQSEAHVGDPVVLWGDGLPVEDIAECAGTIPWTLLCGVTERVKLEYRDG
ncbi:MAG: alanine racemase [Gammaproteobacteria bacterium]